MAGAFTFGDTILALLENEDRLNEQKREFNIESGQRSQQLDIARQNQISEDAARKAAAQNAAADLLLRQQIFGEQKRQYEEGDPLLTHEQVMGLLTRAGMEGLSTGGPSVVIGAEQMRAHNNPMGLKYAGQSGAEAGDEAEDGGNYAKFNSPEEGLQAAIKQLKASKYQNMSVDEAMRTWSGNKVNPNKGYGAEVAPAVKDLDMKDLGPMAFDYLVRQMAQRESGTKISGQPGQAQGGLDFPAMRLSGADKLLDDFIKLADIKEKGQLYSLRARAMLGLSPEDQMNLDAAKKSYQDIMKMPGSVSSGIDLSNPQSLVQKLMGSIPKIPFAAGRGGSATIGDVFSHVFTAEFERTEQARRNLEKEKPGLSAQIGLIDSIGNRAAASGTLSEGDVSNLQDIMGALDQYLSHGDERAAKNIDLSAKITSDGSLTVEQAIRQAMERAARLIKTRTAFPILMQNIKQEAIGQRERETAAFKDELKNK